jgi:hypothetical protein
MAAHAIEEPDSREAVVGRLPQDHALARVRTAVEGVRYGEVRVIIQDGVIVQIERVEKYRLR